MGCANLPIVHAFDKVVGVLILRAQYLLLRSFEWRYHGDEIIRKAPGVVLQQFGNARAFCRANNQSRVMLFLNAIDDLRIVVGGSIGMLLPR